MCQINLNFSKKSFGRILNFGKIIINCDENRIAVPYISKLGKFKDTINYYLEKFEEE